MIEDAKAYKKTKYETELDGNYTFDDIKENM